MRVIQVWGAGSMRRDARCHGASSWGWFWPNHNRGLDLLGFSNKDCRPQLLFVVGGLLGIVVIWIALFRNHVTLHNYQALFAAPLVSISIGVVLKTGVNQFLNGSFRWIVILIAPLIIISPLIKRVAQGYSKANPAELNDASLATEYGKDVESSTPKSAVILSSSPSLIPVYYSHRHIIRGVNDEEALRLLAPKTSKLFSHSDIYLAIPPDRSWIVSLRIFKIPIG